MPGVSRKPNAVEYTKIRGRKFYLSIRIPKDVLSHYDGQTKIVKALGTSDPIVAKRLVRIELAKLEEKWANLRRGVVLSSLVIEREAVSRLNDSLAFMDEHRRAGTLVKSDHSDDPVTDHLREELSEIADEIRDGSFHRVASEAQGIVKSMGVTCPVGCPQWVELCTTLLTARLEAIKTTLRRHQGDRFAAPQLPLNPVLVDRPLDTRLPKLDESAQGESLRSVVDQFLASMEKSGSWTPKTAYQTRSTLDMLCEYVGDVPLKGITRETIGGFKRTLELLPSSYGKSAEDRSRTVLDITNDPKNHDKPKLAQRTIKRHLTAVSGLIDWSTQHGLYAGDNPGKGFKFARSRRAREERSAWTVEELNKLLKGRVWTDRTEGAMFWLPLLALFTGCRLEEVAQLPLGDVRQIDGVWCLDIHPGNGKQLKSSAAVRKIPLHDELIRIGFLSYVDQIKAGGHDRLFPELKPSGPDQRYGAKFSQQFTKLRRDLGVYETGVDFHSFRHSFTTALQEAEVPEPIIDELSGHEGIGRGETARYSKGYTLGKLKDAINRLQYPGLDLKHLS